MRHTELGAPSLYVFVFFVGNDFQNLIESRSATDVGLSAAVDDAPQRQYPTISSRFSWLSRINDHVLNDSVLRRLHLVQWARHKVLLLVNRASADLMDPIFLVMRKDRSYLHDARYVLEQELQRLIATARTLQFDFVFVILPDRHQVNSNLLDAKSEYYGISADQIDPRLPNSVLADTLDAHGIAYVDITECMAGRDDVQALYYTRDNHLTVSGHGAAAKCMSPELEEIVHSNLSLPH
jgi:hypothetical protein